MPTRREVVAGLGALAVGCGGTEGTDSGATDTDVPTTTTTTGCTSHVRQNEALLCFEKYPDLADVDGNVVIESDSEGRLIVVRTGPDAAICVSDVCTHQGCSVTWRSSSGSLFCPCHGSQFDTEGSVIAGPATRPLASYPATVSDDAITVDLS